MNKKQILIISIVAVLLILTTGIALAGGGKNGTYVRFKPKNSSVWIDSYWKTTGSGLVHEWRTTDEKHFVFKPESKFTVADCDPDAYNSFLWTAHDNYDESGADDADLKNVIVLGKKYWVCMYNWTD